MFMLSEQKSYPNIPAPWSQWLKMSYWGPDGLSNLISAIYPGNIVSPEVMLLKLFHGGKILLAPKEKKVIVFSKISFVLCVREIVCFHLKEKKHFLKKYTLTSRLLHAFLTISHHQMLPPINKIMLLFSKPCWLLTTYFFWSHDLSI